jgi:hypothetical protein
VLPDSSKSSRKNGIPDLGKMTLEHQGKTEAVLAPQHLPEMVAAKAKAIGFDPHVGLHHGRAEDQRKLIFLKPPI